MCDASPSNYKSDLLRGPPCPCDPLATQTFHPLLSVCLKLELIQFGIKAQRYINNTAAQNKHEKYPSDVWPGLKSYFFLLSVFAFLPIYIII